MNSKNDNKILRESFEQAANIYQQARPDYPEEIFDDLIHDGAPLEFIQGMLGHEKASTAQIYAQLY